MIKILVCVALILLTSSALHADNKRRIYFDIDWHQCDKKEAAFYRERSKINDTTYEIRECSYDGTPIAIGIAPSDDDGYLMQRHGHYKFIDLDGNIANEGDYKRGLRNGWWKYYSPLNNSLDSEKLFENDLVKHINKFATPTHKIIYNAVYSEGKKISSRSYDDKTGRVIEVDSNDVLTKYDESGNITRQEKSKDGKFVSGFYIDSTGKKVTYTERGQGEGVYMYVEQMPAPGYDLGQYLSKNIHYPSAARKKSIDGRVIVKFEVWENGTIHNAYIVHSVHPLLDQEALRVITLMPKWKPGMQNGKAVKCYFNQPIRFALY